MANKKTTDAQVKAALKTLKAKGLYTGDLRKAPTRYAKDLTKKFSDVIAGRAQVVTVPRKPSGAKNTGTVAARNKAKEIAATFTETMRAKGNKVVVKVARGEERARYVPSSGTIETSYKDRAGVKSRHAYVKGDVDKLPDLRTGESYALPFSRGRNGVAYKFFANRQELLDELLKYENDPKKPYKGVRAHVQIVSRGKRRNIPKPRASSTRTASNVVPFPNARNRRGR